MRLENDTFVKANEPRQENELPLPSGEDWGEGRLLRFSLWTGMRPSDVHSPDGYLAGAV